MHVKRYGVHTLRSLPNEMSCKKNGGTYASLLNREVYAPTVQRCGRNCQEVGADRIRLHVENFRSKKESGNGSKALHRKCKGVQLQMQNYCNRKYLYF